MPYDASKDIRQYPGPSSTSFGRKSRAVTPSDSTDLDPYAKAVVVLSVGDLVILPVDNADGSTVTFEDVPIGFIPPFQVRRVYATGTTATVATVDG